MITVKSKNQFGEEIIVNKDKIIYAIPSSGGNETVIFFSSDNHITIEEPFVEFKKRFFEYPYTSSKREVAKDESLDENDDLYAALPRLPNGNIDKRTVQYKEYMANKNQ